jgi:hypothetical protein
MPSSDAPVSASDAATDTSCVDLLVGPAGGTLHHPAGASISIPVGALVSAVRLSLCGIQAPPASTLGATPVGQGFQAGPEGLTFLRPVTVTLPYESALLPATGATVGIRTAPGGATTFVGLASQPSLSSGTVVATTVHFSQFVPSTPGSALTVTPAPTLPNGTTGTQYEQVLQVTGGTPPYAFTVASESNLPSGLGLTADGYLAGVPAAPGVFAFFIHVADSGGQSIEVGEAMTVLSAVNLAPVLTGITPSAIAAGSGDLTIALYGSDFAPNAQAAWDGAPIATAFGSASFLGATIPAADLVSARMHGVTVTNPGPGGGTSQGVSFTVVEAIDAGTQDGGPADGEVGDAGAAGGDGAAGTDDGSSCGDLFTAPITLTGTLSGTLPPFPETGPQPAFLRVDLCAAYHYYATVAGGPPTCQTPTMDGRCPSYQIFPLSSLTLPKSYTFSDNIGNGDGGNLFCAVGYAVEVSWLDSSLLPIGMYPGGLGSTQCGCVDGVCAGGPNYGAGGPPITCSPVICNVTIH